jgi:hypothetical protein
MGRFSKKFEKIFSAITFAEAGEFETAREILKEDEPNAEDANVIKTGKKITSEPEPSKV